MLNFLKETRKFVRGYTMTNIFNLFLSKDLKKYWKNSDKKNFDKNLIISMEKFLNSEDYRKTSTNHKFAIIKILKVIERFNNKESANDFQFNNPNFHSDFSTATISELLIDISDQEAFEDLFKLYPSLKAEHSIKLNLLNNLIYNKIKNRKVFSKINDLSDKTFVGNDKIYNEVGGLKITQEKLRTLIEYENIETLINQNNTKILEIGSGNGRMCECILSCNEKVSKYILVDIPPALPSAFKRLKLSLKNKKLCYAIDAKNREELEKIIQNNDVIFLFPNQINILQKNFDLFLAIDCLHEMKKNTIKEYMQIASIISKKVYFKVHETAHVPFSFDILSIHNNQDYSISPNWNLIYKKKSLFPSNDYEVAYETK